MKQINISLKMLGKKQAALEQVPHLLSSTFPEQAILSDLIVDLVKQQVEHHNTSRDEENPLLAYLSDTDIDNQASRGAVKFGAVYQTEKTDPAKAVETALQAFQDGLYYVFIDRKKIETLQTPIHLQSESELLFLRLTALVGGYY